MNIQCPSSATLGSYALFGVDVDAITIANRNILKLTHLAIGHYPQTYVGNTLNTTLESLYNNGNLQAGLTATGHSYTTSVLCTTTRNAQQEYTILLEYIYNGSKYARLTSAVEYENNGFSDGTNIVYGMTYWFKVEPISVMVMATNSSINDELLTVMSDVALGSHRYNNMNVISWKDTPEIRIFLNGGIVDNFSVGFYGDALANVASVVQTTIKNQAVGSHAIETSGADYNTTDYVWLPSYWEMTNSSNGFNTLHTPNESRQREATDFAKATCTYANITTFLGYNYYWMRTRANSSHVYCIEYDGRINMNEEYHFPSGYVPCFAISL
jgi:hypothetical protein